MDEDGFIRFEVNDQDIEEELNPGRGRRQTKEDQIYGIWADRDDENGRPAFGQKKKDYSGPIGFVSGGVSVGSKMDKEEDEEPVPSTSVHVNKEDYVEVSVFSKPKIPYGNKKGGNSRFAGMGSAQPAAGMLFNSGKSDIIMKMMNKMGYEKGKGLGANKQGIVEPVTAAVRKGRGAVGAYGAEQKGPKFGESAADAQKRHDDKDIEEIEEEEMPNDSWKKARKVRVKYKTLNEVVADSNSVETMINVPKQKIIDFTGKEQKTYDDIHAFHKRKPVRETSKRPNFDVPALTENLNTLLSNCEQEILKNYNYLEELKTKNKGLERDQEEGKRDMEDSKDQMNRIDGVIELMQRFDCVGSDVTDLDELRQLFSELRQKYPVEFKIYNLDCVIQFKVLPLIKKMYLRWDPLDPEQAEFGLQELEIWKKVLSSKTAGMFDENKQDNKAIPPFDMLFWEGWLPQIRRAALRWDPRSNSPLMMTLMQYWLPLLPGWIVDNIFDQIIIPRIATAVDNWDPINDDQPLDQWLAPWHDLLGDRLLDIFAHVRQKMAGALRKWVATDLSAVAVIKPWLNVFSNKHMADFLNANIVPKLENSLRQMNLDPVGNGTFTEFYSALAWRGLISDEMVCRMLTRNMFDRWYDMLCRWLEAPAPMADRSAIVQEVARYYKEWKQRVPEDVMAWAPITSEFGRAVKAIGQAKNGLPIQRLESWEEFSAKQQIYNAIRPPTPPPAAESVTINQKTLRNHVEQVAREKGILFVPLKHKSENGRQVYSLGNKTIYFDGTVVCFYDQATRQWLPASVHSLFNSDF